MIKESPEFLECSLSNFLLTIFLGTSKLEAFGPSSFEVLDSFSRLLENLKLSAGDSLVAKQNERRNSTL